MWYYVGLKLLLVGEPLSHYLAQNREIFHGNYR
jgi:hypothetical protein